MRCLPGAACADYVLTPKIKSMVSSPSDLQKLSRFMYWWPELLGNVLRDDSTVSDSFSILTVVIFVLQKCINTLPQPSQTKGLFLSLHWESWEEAFRTSETYLWNRGRDVPCSTDPIKPYLWKSASKGYQHESSNLTHHCERFPTLNVHPSWLFFSNFVKPYSYRWTTRSPINPLPGHLP